MDTFIDNYDDWVDLAKSFVGDTYAQDIVQEAYIKLSGYESKDFNRGYIYLTIRSLCFDFLKAKNRIVKEEIEDYNAEYVDETETKQAYNALLAKIDAEIETWHWYDRELFKLYKDTPMSLRTLANETGISITSIHITIKRCKDILNEKFSEDYHEYSVGNYELFSYDKSEDLATPRDYIGYNQMVFNGNLNKDKRIVRFYHNENNYIKFLNKKLNESKRIED